MIRPEPVVIDGRAGTIVFLDADREPVEPSDPSAVVAKAVFDDGGRTVYTVAPKSQHLGSDKSGNYGHAGRPGEVGGSAPAKDTKGTTGIEFTTRTAFGSVGTKKDGGKVLLTSKPLTEEVRKKVFGDHNIETIIGQMVEDIPGHLQASYGQAGDDIVTVEVTGAHGLEMVRYFRRLPNGDLEVQHRKFELPKSMRGKDVAKATLADAMHTYKQLGVKLVTMTANMDVGSYAWARYGFKAKVPSNMAEDLYNQLSPIGTRAHPFPTLTLSERRSLQEIVMQHSDDPKLPWHLAGARAADGRQIGKELLLNQSWGAVMELDDPEAMARFNHYVEGH